MGVTVEKGFHPAIDPRVDGFEKLDFTAMFGNDHPVVLEIGSGKGRFLVSSAQTEFMKNFVGIEKSLHYHRVIERRLVTHQLTNARIINHDAFEAIQRMFLPASVDEIHSYFPDPWPRPRERKRRLIREEVLEQFRRILKGEGRGVYVTDHREYFEKALPIFQQLFEVELVDVSSTPPRTNYEAKYREEGRPIFEARFRQRSDVKDAD